MDTQKEYDDEHESQHAPLLDESQHTPLLDKDIEAGEPVTEKQRMCKVNDIAFAILFVATFVMTVVFACMYGHEGVSNSWNDPEGRYMTSTLAIAAFSFVPTLCWVVLFLLIPRFLINVSMFVLFVVNVTLAVVWTLSFKESGIYGGWWWWPAVVFSILALMVLVVTCKGQRRIQFASVVLMLSAKVSKKNFLLLVFSGGIGFVQMFLVWMSIAAAVGIQYHYGFIEADNGAAIGGIWFAFIFIAFWLYETSRGIVAVMSSSVAARWWKKPDVRGGAVLGLGKAVTLHLGSIAFGSAVVAILEAINALVRSLENMAASNGNCCAVCAACMFRWVLGCLEYTVRLFNRFAFAFIGIFGYSFCDAGKRAWKFWDERGFLAIANDYFLENVLGMCSFVTACLCCALGYHLGRDEYFTKYGSSSADFTLGTIGFFVGYVVSEVSLSAISASATAITIMYCSDLETLRENNPEDHEKLVEVLHEVYPAELATMQNGSAKLSQ